MSKQKPRAFGREYQIDDGKVIVVPESYSEVKKRMFGSLTTAPIVSYTTSGTAPIIGFLRHGYSLLGEPEWIRCFVNDTVVAFVPAPEDHHNSYKVTSHGTRHTMGGGWLEYEIGFRPVSGRYELFVEGDIVKCDFSEPVYVMEDD